MSSKFVHNEEAPEGTLGQDLEANSPTVNVTVGTGDAAQPARIHSLLWWIHSLLWFLLSVVFNVAFMACLSLLLDQKVFNIIAPAFMAYKKKWAFLSHLGFIIIGSPICYALYAILILLLNRARGRWVGFLVKRAYVLAHEVVLYMTKDIILAHLVFSFHGCYFICFMKLKTPQDKMQLIKVCTLEFARSALRFSFHGKWMSAGFFLFTAFIGFLAMVLEANSSTVEVIETRDGLTEEITSVNQEQLGMHIDIVGTGDAAQPTRIHSLPWFLLSVPFNVASLSCLILLLDKNVFKNIAPAFMAYKKKRAFLFYIGFIITGSAICYLLYAILISLLKKERGRWVGFLVKRTFVLAHEVVLYMTKDIILAHLVFSLHGCSFISFMKFMTPQDKMQLIKVCTMEFVRSALRFSFQGKWMSASFFLVTAFIGFLAMVNFDLMKNLPNAAGEVADNIADIVAD